MERLINRLSPFHGTIMRNIRVMPSLTHFVQPSLGCRDIHAQFYDHTCIPNVHVPNSRVALANPNKPRCGHHNRTMHHHTHKLVHKELNALYMLGKRSELPIRSLINNTLSPLSVNRYFSTSTCLGQQSSNNEPGKDQNPDDEEKMPLMARVMLMFWASFFLWVFLRVMVGEEGTNYKFISWNEFYYDMLAKGEVEHVTIRNEQELAFVKLIPGAIVRGNKVNSSEAFAMKVADIHKFENKLRRAEAELGIKPGNGVTVSYQRENSWAALVVFIIVIAVLFLVLRSTFKIQMPSASDMFASERKAKFLRADLIRDAKGRSINFKDVAGLHEAKVEVMEFVDFLKRPEKYKELGGRIPRGALLLGPPGCGKTLLAKAVASEANVPFLAMAGSEFVEMLGGLGAARVRDLFKEAGKKAPCIIYVDEIDAIGRKRGANNMAESSEEEHTLNQLLVEMDGMSSKEGVIMLASTNRAEVLDKALLRPGRFDRHIQIELPTLAERKEIFDMYLRKLKLKSPVTQYSEKLAQLSPGMSGADIANICNEAALHAARDLKKSIDHDDFEYAVERVVAGVAKKSRVLSQQEKKVVAYHEAGHALVGWLTEHTDSLVKVSIVPRTNNALGFAQYMPQDKFLLSKDEIFEKMCMALGGRVAEAVIFNSVTSGAQDDLKKVTQMASTQIREFGMSDKLGHVSFPKEGDGGKPYSKALQTLIDHEVQGLVAQAYRQTETLLLKNTEKLHVIADALLEKESLTYKDMEQLIGPPTK